MNEKIKLKYNGLKNFISQLGECVIAFSGGIDSSLLLYAALETISRDKVKAITIKSPAMPEQEFEQALETADFLKVKPIVLEINNIKVINEKGNNALRCYHCKKALFSQVLKGAESMNLDNVIEGTNISELSGHRPGLKALEELGIISPYLECKIDKNEIRQIAKVKGLKVWDKPSSPCLISRFPYDVEIKDDELKKVDLAEDYINSLGFAVNRVRNFGGKCVIEVEKSRVDELKSIIDKIKFKMNEIGFSCVEIANNGYIQGSMDKL